ncbi:11030_t:CDS:2 [Funneliformis geosporum]|nr:11030_t:CDS:2 [Funneliformis geosporum]
MGEAPKTPTQSQPPTREPRLPPKDDSQPCLNEACQIQTCLQKNDYQEARCQQAIDKLLQCCDKLLKSGGESPSCSSFGLEFIQQMRAHARRYNCNSRYGKKENINKYSNSIVNICLDEYDKANTVSLNIHTIQ